jgi:hypothetical protein
MIPPKQSKTYRCPHCGGMLMRAREYDTSMHTYVCHNDACPLNVEAQKKLDVQANVRALVGTLMLLTQLGVGLGLLALFIRWVMSW